MIFLAPLTVMTASIITRRCPCHPVREPGDPLSEQTIPLPPPGTLLGQTHRCPEVAYQQQ